MLELPGSIGKVWLAHCGGRFKFIVQNRTLQIQTRGSVLCASSFLFFMMTASPDAHAGPMDDLASSIAAVRSEAGCGQLELVDGLSVISERVNESTDTYIQHTTRSQPIEDVGPELANAGIAARKFKLLTGYGGTSAKSEYGLILQGHLFFPDCEYTKYGLDVRVNDTGGYTLTAAVLVAV